MYELPHEFMNNLRRILGNQEISRKSLECLDTTASTQPATQKPNFNILRKKSHTVNCKTFHKKTYFAQFREFFLNHATYPRVLWIRTTHATHVKILTHDIHVTHAKIRPTPPNPNTHTNHPAHEFTLPSSLIVFSKLSFSIFIQFNSLPDFLHLYKVTKTRFAYADLSPSLCRMISSDFAKFYFSNLTNIPCHIWPILGTYCNALSRKTNNGNQINRELVKKIFSHFLIANERSKIRNCTVP